MRKTLTESVGPYRYAITQLGARQGMLVYRRLASLLGGAADSIQGGGEGAALKAIGKIVQNLSDEDLQYFVDTFAPMTAVSGVEFTKGSPQLDTVFEEHFAGRMLAMTQWLIGCFKVNFADLFVSLGTGGASEAAAAAPANGSPSISPKDVIGRFGASSQANG